MSTVAVKRAIPVVSACLTADGTPGFALNEVEVSEEDAANGVHYDLVDKLLLKRRYEEPFVHFAQDESPAFLHSAVRHYLGL